MQRSMMIGRTCVVYETRTATGSIGFLGSASGFFGSTSTFLGSGFFSSAGFFTSAGFFGSGVGFSSALGGGGLESRFPSPGSVVGFTGAFFDSSGRRIGSAGRFPGGGSW